MTATKNTSRSRQRLRIVIVIIVLLVIFLPNLWQKSYRPKINIWQIPPRPKMNKMQSIKDVPEIKLQTPKRVKALAWMLQLGSFTRLERARRLLERLRAHGYPAYMQDIAKANGIIIKVYVGPQIKRGKLQAEAITIERNLHLKGTILPFNVFSTN